MASGFGGWLKGSVIVIHRWLGVALCLFFLVWFPSGIGIMYWDYPSVGPDDRRARLPVLDAGRIALSPAEAYARLAAPPTPTQVRLTSFDGRPAYRFRFPRGESIVYADTGEEQIEVSKEMMERTAMAWSGQPVAAARVELLDDVDQWTIQVSRALRPLWKYSWPDGQQVYLSDATGDVVQYTTAGSRWGAYVGAIPHWLYFTPLRKHGPQWSQVVIWTSGIGTLSAILGIIVGIWMYSPSKRYRRAGVPTSIPYRGQKRWHMLLGLIFGIATATWAFSGMLSMDPFPERTSGAAGRRSGTGIPQALRGRLQLEPFAARHAREVVAKLAGLGVTELDLSTLGGEPFYLATVAGGGTRVVPLDDEPRADFDRQRIIDIVRAAAGERLAEIRELDRYDRYYLDRRRARPLPVLLVRLNDDEQTRYYIDPKTASVVGGYSTRSWTTRWLYHGLHSLDFPWLYNYRPVWDIVVIAFMLGGTALGVTSLILAWRVVGRKLNALLATGSTSRRLALSDDLAVDGE